jgi:hypothetical protein
VKCEKCGTHLHGGSHYVFYYAKVAGVSSSAGGTVLAITTRYQIGGSEKVFICDRCVTEEMMNPVQIAASLLAVSGGVCMLGGVYLLFTTLLGVGKEIGLGWIAFDIVVLMSGVMMIALTPRFFRWKRSQIQRSLDLDKMGEHRYRSETSQAGDKLAIRLKRVYYKRNGYDKFFTRVEHRGLVRSTTGW